MDELLDSNLTVNTFGLVISLIFWNPTGLLFSKQSLIGWILGRLILTYLANFW